MISLLVSSKTMVAHLGDHDLPETTPRFLDKAQQLNTVLRTLTPKQLQSVMHISAKLAAETHERIMNWNPTDGTPTWYTFVGDVYKGLKVHELTKEEVTFAQEHLATLSGLYGILRPLDTVHPYRLELMYKLSGKGFKNLYDFWGGSVAKTIPKDEPVINLASEEYIKLVRPYLAKDQVITPWFFQTKDGQPDFQTVHAKMARGAMARFIAQQRVNNPTDLKDFNLNGYYYSKELSKPLKPAFIRAEGHDFRADY